MEGPPTIRTLAVAGWATILVVLVRIAWGGWLGGFRYVIQTESLIAVAVGTVLALGAVWLMLSFAAGPTRRATRLSIAGAIIAFTFGAFLFIDGHRSGLAMMAAALVVLMASLRLAVRTGDVSAGP